MKRKNLFTSAVIITATLSLSACMSGCGKQGVEPVMAATIEQETLTSEVTTEEESVIATEEETESIEETTTDEAETESVAVQDFTITEINLELQATENAMTYENPDGNTEVSGVRKDEIITVIGKVDDTDWYQIDQEGFKSFIDSKYLKEIEPQPEVKKPAETAKAETPKPEVQTPAPEVQTPAPEVQTPAPEVQTPAPEVQTPTPEVQTPAPEVQPPVELPAPGEVLELPDGGCRFDDGTEIHPGDVSQDGSVTYMGCCDDWF